MKTVTIGDLHGRDVWKKLKSKVDEYDKIVFVGDYLDNSYLSNIIILHNLKELVDFKKDNPDKVVLLLGNHDVSYLFEDQVCSGYQPEMKDDVYKLLSENKDLFQFSYQYGTTLWTHAGVHRGWWEYYFQPILEGKKERRYFESLKECKTLSDTLNLMFNNDEGYLYMCSPYRGGKDKVSGPLWLDKTELYKKPLEGYHQIVGHTKVDGIKTYDFKNNTRLTFVDSLWSKSGKFYELEL